MTGEQAYAAGVSLERRQFLRGVAGAAASACLARSAMAQTRPEASPAQPSPLHRRVIPSSGERIPAIGMGTWQTFDPPALTPDHLNPLAEVLRRFHAGGGRLIDSSPMYGKSEEVVGLLSDRLGLTRELFIATKVWTRGRDAGIRQMRQSMSELKRDKLELMQVHNLVDVQTHLKILRDWKAQGTFRHIGITHYQPSAFDELERLMKTEKLDFVQLPYSISFRDAEARLLPTARDTGTAVLVMRPFEGGNLFASVRDKPLPDHIKPYAASWAQAFLKFILSHEAVTCAIPATSKPQNMADNIAALTDPLPTAEQRAALIREIR